MGLKTGIYSGSFNPIHVGHLALANWLREFGGLDEVWFIVVPHNPLKEKDGLLDDSLRLKMARATIDGCPKFRICDIEFYLPEPSCSIDTLRTLSRNYPNQDFCFIMGTDSWQLFPRWKGHEKALQDYKLLIYSRLGFNISIPVIYPDVKKVDAPLMEISSMFIRNAYQTDKGIRFFLPGGVWPYFGSVVNQWHTYDRRYTHSDCEVYILRHLKYIFFEKGSYTVIICSFAVLGQSAKIPIKTCSTTQPLKMIPVTSK